MALGYDGEPANGSMQMPHSGMIWRQFSNMIPNGASVRLECAPSVYDIAVKAADTPFAETTEEKCWQSTHRPQ